jgi:hypothetical protein
MRPVFHLKIWQDDIEYYLEQYYSDIEIYANLWDMRLMVFLQKLISNYFQNLGQC